MKYIVLKIKIDSGIIEQELPFMFPDMINHDDFADSMKHELLFNHEIDSEVVSAGFCNFFGSNPSCFGESETLKIGSRTKKDDRLISTFNYEHGLV